MNVQVYPIDCQYTVMSHLGVVTEHNSYYTHQWCRMYVILSMKHFSGTMMLIKGVTDREM